MIRKIKRSDFQDYQRFLNSFGNQYLFYAHRNYLNSIIATTNGIEETLIYERDGEILGVLPLLSKKGKYGKVYNSLPFYGSHGGVITAFEEVKEALYQYIFSDVVGKSDTCLVMVSENPLIPINEEWQFDSDVILEDRICQVTPFKEAETENDIMELFHSKTRNMVRKAEKAGFTMVDSLDLLQPMYDLHKENMNAINGTVKPYSFYEQIQSQFIYGKDYRVVGAEIDGELAAVLLLFYHANIVDYHTPTINIKYRSLQPNSFLIYHCMRDAYNSGFKLWNWGGTWKTQKSLYRFKSRWGAVDYKYRYLIKVRNQDIYSSEPEELLSEYQYFYTIPFQYLK